VAELLTPLPTVTPILDADPPLRELAFEQLKKKRDFRTHLLAYVLVNAFFWLIWGVILTAADGTWFPWPLFPLVGWGIGLTFHYIYGYRRAEVPIRERQRAVESYAERTKELV
jgi:uncharacterized membrane protein (DUF485 family)